MCVETLELEGKIHKNVYIENIDFSGLTKSEAEIKLKDIIKNNDELNLHCGEKNYQIKLSELNINYKIKEAIEEAYSIGRGEGFISNIKTKVKLDMGETCKIDLKYTYDDKSIENYISYIKKEIDKEPINATIKIENDSIVLEKETYGVKVDTSKLKDILISKADKIILKEEQIPIGSIKPIHVQEELEKIDTVLGTFETRFNKNTVGRVNNIYVAAEATSNLLINPYEEFSFNNYTSNKSFVSKLKKAPVIRNGKLEDGLGGGICQVSTTIYNAALYAGLEITNVRNHSIPSSYIEKGRDATVSSGNLDLKFKNNFDTPILIYNKVFEDKIISTIYGNSSDKKDIEIVTETIKTIPKKIKYIDSDSLYIGQREIKKKGREGYKVNTFRVYNRQEEKVKELICECYYPPMAEEILQGTKRKEIIPKENVAPKEEAQPKEDSKPKEEPKEEIKHNLNTEII